jgi:hypothetical protein
MSNARSLFQRLRRPLALALALAGLLAGAAPAGAATTPDSLPANIPMSALPAACDSAPAGSVCTNAVVGALDGARAAVGLGPYVLPANFDALAGTKQIFILSNLDRIAYGLPVITGLSPELAATTRSAMTGDSDPDPTAALGGLSSYAWTSNWAGDWANAPYAYYEWMYDDGYGGGETSNVDCSSATATGCWVHRRNVLAFAGSGTLSMGASVGNDAHGQSSYATTLVWTPDTNWSSYSFTWAQAQADGAGVAHSGSVGPPRASRQHRRRIPH